MLSESYLNELALFFWAFLAGTVLPFSSEVAFATALANDMPALNALFFASLGNILAIIVNYFLGIFLYTKTRLKLKSSKTGRRAIFFGKKYAYYSLFLSWLPVIGDPITLVAGMLKLKFIWFIIIAGGFRVLRYYIIYLGML